VPVSVQIKRTLTTVQIIQFLLGFVLGYSYLFIAYDVSPTGYHPLGNRTTPASHVYIPNSRSSNMVCHIDGHIWLGDATEPKEATAYGTLHCLSDSGKAFPIMVATVYVVPLLYMFCRFFARNYSLPRK
jgi:hypothetical protein